MIETSLRRPALYYPYIHIRDERWLKATLFCLPTVKRIVPANYTPEDDPVIKKYTNIVGPNGPLLQTVPAVSPAADRAQDELLNTLRRHQKEIKGKYRRSRAPKADAYWIHDAKFNAALLEYLRGKDLAWESQHSNPYGHRRWYALHPTLGSAIMTTIGLSIAREEQYDIVTPSAQWHETLLATDPTDITQALLHGPQRHPTIGTATVRNQLAQLVITLTDVNYSAIPPEAIPELQASPHLNDFQDLIRASAATINSETAEGYQVDLNQTAERIIKAWQATKRDLLKQLGKTAIAVAAADALKVHYNAANPTGLIIDAGVTIATMACQAGAALWKPESPYHYIITSPKSRSHKTRRCA